MNHLNKPGISLTLEEIISIGKQLLNKSFREIGGSQDIDNKGGLGQFIEKHVFNIEQNNRPEPDFIHAATELKVTPVRKLRSGNYSAKERLVLNIIDYIDEATKTFYTSSFWRKNAILYILFYLYEEGKDKLDYLILKDDLLDFNQLKYDLSIIKQDWEIIHQKIVSGRAHEISEADTLYLGACTKGVSSKTTRTQFNSDIPAKQRAYSLKTTYMTEVFNRTPLPSILDLLVDTIELEKKGFESIIEDKLKPFIGKSQSELKDLFGIKSTAKNINELLVAAMLGLKNTKVSSTQEFRKANILPKTIRVEENNTIREHMSFSPFKFTQIIEETWDDSELKDFFETTKFMFVVFKKMGKDYFFKGIRFWNMSSNDIEYEVSKVWNKTVDIIKHGKIVRAITHQRETYFPKPKNNPVAHVRPHARNSFDQYPLPIPDKLTGLTSYMKHSFWLNKTYILNIIKSKL